jgi:hypothetical protein
MRKEPVPKAVPIHFPKDTPAEGSKTKRKQVGTVLLVNAEAGFVLIDSQGRGLPERGAALKYLHEGADAGVLTVSGERQGSHVIADIVTGTPKKGDQVFQ